MSTGDIDDRLGPEGRLEELRKEYPDLDNYLTGLTSIVVNRDYDIPYTAGISTDGLTVYIDRRLNLDLDGKDLTPAVMTHECVEWALREFCSIGEDYQYDPTGHRLANRAEMEVAEHILGRGQEAWDLYDDFMDPQVRRIEHAKIEKVPSDLALYPYEGTAYLRRLKKAMT